MHVHVFLYGIKNVRDGLTQKIFVFPILTQKVSTKFKTKLYCFEILKFYFSGQLDLQVSTDRLLDWYACNFVCLTTPHLFSTIY